MKRYLPLSLVSFFFLGLTTLSHGGHPAKDAEGFEVIFDGSNMEKLETEGNWKIGEDGSLVLEPREGESGWKRYHHYVWLKDTYKDFVFDFEYKHPKGGNSGFYFRISDKVDPVETGFEVQILDSLGKPDSEMGHHDNGGIIKTQGASKNMSKEPGEWNRMTVTMKGNQLIVVLNGEAIQNFDLAAKKPKDKDLAAEGLISIQDHGQPFQIRNLRVKRL
ncbi:MAG: DUF1080 domain-containing protein [Verrucomicrobiales bacterium]|jgi:hypothetical protein|nr:DUF1080 domain-containing protein [Verrucomicrobiales bacterium]